MALASPQAITRNPLDCVGLPSPPQRRGRGGPSPRLDADGEVTERCRHRALPNITNPTALDHIAGGPPPRNEIMDKIMRLASFTKMQQYTVLREHRVEALAHDEHGEHGEHGEQGEQGEEGEGADLVPPTF